MANVIRSTADTAGFVPQFWAQKALDVLRANIVLAQTVARDTDFADAGYKGKSITIPYPGTFTPVDKVEGTPVTPVTPVGGQSVTLTLAKHKVVPFEIEDFAAAQANSDLMQRYVEPACIALAEQFESDLWQTALGGGGTTLADLGTGTTDISAATVRTANKDLNVVKAPKAQRSLIVSPKDEMALVGDTNLATYWAFSQADSIRNGYVGRLYGFDTYMSQVAPAGYTVAFASADSTLSFGGNTTASIDYDGTTATAAAVQALLEGLDAGNAGKVKVRGPLNGPYSVTFDPSLTGTLTASTATVVAAQKNLALHRNALMYACRPFAPIPASAGVQTAQANDPESGLSIRISTQYDINAIGMRANLDILYGTVVLRPNQAVIIDS